MAKQQQLIDLFPKYDQDNDGEIDFQQFSDLITELGLPHIYPGTIKKNIRRLNYENPDKETINLQQTKDYFNSLQTQAKHDIWKSKYGLLEWAQHVRHDTYKQQMDLNAAAAPGSHHTKEAHQSASQPQGANIKILIGPNKPTYKSEIDIELEKNSSGAKVKPFVKFTCTYKNPAQAKQMEGIFKSNFTQFLKLLAGDLTDWADEMNNFKINSMVQGNTVVFFITTANEEMVSLLQLFSEMLEMSFGTQNQGKAHLRYEFQYDFEDYLKNTNSSFYDFVIKGARLVFNAKAKNSIREIRKYFKNTQSNIFYGGDILQCLIPVGFLHLDDVQADIQFDCPENVQGYELETREEIDAALQETAQLLSNCEEGGMKIRQLLQLLNCEVNLEASVGQWRARVYLRLPNLAKLFLNAMDQQKASLSQDQKQTNTETASLAYPTLNQNKPPPQKPSKLAKKDALGNSISSDSQSSQSVKSFKLPSKPATPAEQIKPAKKAKAAKLSQGSSSGSEAEE